MKCLSFDVAILQYLSFFLLLSLLQRKGLILIIIFILTWMIYSAARSKMITGHSAIKCYYYYLITEIRSCVKVEVAVLGSRP